MLTYRIPPGVCCAHDECHGCEDNYRDLWWSSFTSLWTWVVHQNMLVEVNKYLIEDLARSEELLEKARVKLGDKKWTLPRRI